MKHLTTAEIDAMRASSLKAGAARFWEMAHEVSDEYGIPISLITNPTRGAREVVEARFIICAKARRMGFSLIQIGAFIHRDHTTVMHNARRGEDILAGAK